MNFQDFTKVLRTRWITVCVTVLVTVLAAIAYNLVTTPLYQASIRLFISSTAGASVTDIYQGNLFSQERVKSYTQLVTGETLAQRTIDKLGLDMTAKQLQKEITANTPTDTVLINVNVLDKSPVRARDIANTLSDEFVSFVRELETPEKGGTPNARVFVEQRATIPDRPVVPKTARNLLVGLALGVLLGIGLAVLRDLLDNTVKTQETLEEVAGTGVAGYIPLDKRLSKTPAISFDTENSRTAEAFRKLRTNLQFLAVDSPPRLIVITSSSTSEGKSTTAINIALALAEAGSEVLIVDGDMRRPSLARYLGLVESVGFSTVLSGAIPVADALQKTQFRRLTALTSGAAPPNPSELLGSLSAKKVLSELRAQFDFVIVDSSPLLAVTDGAILAANADGALIIARSGTTKREHLAHSIGVLKDVGALVLGAVLTMVPTRGDASYTYGYYGPTQGGATSKRRRATKGSPANRASQPADETSSRNETSADKAAENHDGANHAEARRSE
ncbi:polysaccharide biosynthesis tyrosine autokinase [Mycolicibacterium sp. Dal123E01]|uniref:polysaccharide biosynthesis tyrosine autokinase n=1 Tax=Mycolicibacterium sp. Dal123E01 TaxID=3457578 RepID=UPI00403E3E0A